MPAARRPPPSTISDSLPTGRVIRTALHLRNARNEKMENAVVVKRVETLGFKVE